MKRMVICLAWVVATLAAAAPAAAQEQRASIEGTIRDSSGGVLPGVTVEARSPSLAGVESTVSGKSQVPFVGNLPLVGMLFKNQRDRTVREEVIILLTPHIVKDDAAYSRMSEQELRMAEQLRVGVRKGMMPWSRERLAEGWY